jgi:hypothetical protein
MFLVIPFLWCPNSKKHAVPLVGEIDSRCQVEYFYLLSEMIFKTMNFFHSLIK